MKFIINILIFLFFSVNVYANSVATITAIRGEASLERGTKQEKAILGSKIFEKDTIKTGDKTKLQMIFNDETIVTLGKNSNFSVEEYLFEDTKTPSVKFGMLRGAMRTITGKIGKIAPQKFIVSTKTATIGIRGTNFSIIIEDDGSFDAYCTYGAISVRFNSEEFIVQQGYYIHISPDGKVEIKEFTPQDLKNMKKQYFSFLRPKDGTVARDAGVEDEEQLDVTVTDISAELVEELEEQNQDNLQRASLADLLASYTMNNAIYSGTYSGIDSGASPVSGAATLDIDFGADTINLNAGGYIFNLNPQFSSTSFTVDGSDVGYGPGSATGEFQESTGNRVIGNYDQPDSLGTASGTYDVSTSQALH